MGIYVAAIESKAGERESYSRYEAYKRATDYVSFIDPGLAHFAAIGNTRSKNWQTAKLQDALRWDLSHEFLFTTPPSLDDVNLSLNNEKDEEGMILDEWFVARCNLLPKKRNIGLCKKWRGINLLNIAGEYCGPNP